MSPVLLSTPVHRMQLICSAKVLRGPCGREAGDCEAFGAQPSHKPDTYCRQLTQHCVRAQEHSEAYTGNAQDSGLCGSIFILLQYKDQSKTYLCFTNLKVSRLLLQADCPSHYSCSESFVAICIQHCLTLICLEKPFIF